MKKIIAFALLIILILLFGCETEQPNQELTQVKTQLKWLHQAQFAGNYIALEKGLYRNLGIDASDLRPFDFERLPIEEVQNRNVEFGIAGADELIVAKSLGKADNVKAIAVIYKINPVVLYSLKESGIIKPIDFIGKTVGIERASDGTDINVGILYIAMLNKLGIDRDSINEITIGYDATELLEGKTDVSSGYVINEPYGAVKEGKEINKIFPAEYGVNMYADVIITHTGLIEKDPGLVMSYLKATLDGWQYAIENEEEAVNIVLRYAKGSTIDHQTYMLKQSIPLIHQGEQPIGWMNPEDWEETQKILFEQEIISNTVNLEEVYTNKFLEEIYNLNK